MRRTGASWRVLLRVFFFMVCPLAPGLLGAQTLRGFVTDAEEGTSLELVHVVLSSLQGGMKGTVTDLDGSYLLPSIEPGRYVLSASRIGYEVFTDSLEFTAADSRVLNIELSPGIALRELVVESERVRSSAGYVAARPRDIARIPMPDLTGDLAGYLAAMPGVVTVGDRGGQFFIRGGEPAQNLVQIDGVMVYQPMHILGFYSAFPSGIISRSDIYAGGFGTRFGERISSVIDVAARSGSTKHFAGSATLSPFISSAQLEGPLIPGRLSVLASLRRSLVKEGASRLIRGDIPFDFGDLFLKVAASITASSRASLLVLRTHDRGSLHEGPSPDEVRWENRSAGVRYLVLPRKYPLSADIRASYSYLASELGQPGAPAREGRIENRHFSADATFYGDRTDVDAGMTLRVIATRSMLGGLYQNIEVASQKAEHVATYVEPEFRFGAGLRLRPGLRIQFFDMRFAPFVEPRMRIEWERGRHQLSAASGLYHQAVLGLSDRRDAASVFTVWTSAPRPQSDGDDVRAGRAQRALHALFGYRLVLPSGLQFRAESFIKRLDNLYIAEWTAYPRFTTRLQPATGSVRGFDLRLELRRRLFYGQVSYGYAATRYAAQQASLQLWYGEEALAFNPPHDRRHQLNVLLSATLRGFEASARLSFGSGLPFSRPVAFDGFVPVDDITSIASQPGSRRVIYERPYAARLPAYHRLDASVARTFAAGGADVTVQASVINLYDRSNLFYLDVFTLRRVDQLPVVPSFGLKVAF